MKNVKTTQDKLKHRVAQCALYLQEIDQIKHMIEYTSSIAVKDGITREEFDALVTAEYTKNKDDFQPAIMTLEQSEKFDELWDTFTLQESSGEDGLIHNIYEDFGNDAYKVCTRIECQGKYSELLVYLCSDDYDQEFYCEIPLDHRAKRRFKELICIAMVPGLLNKVIL